MRWMEKHWTTQVSKHLTQLLKFATFKTEVEKTGLLNDLHFRLGEIRAFFATFYIFVIGIICVGKALKGNFLRGIFGNIVGNVILCSSAKPVHLDTHRSAHIYIYRSTSTHTHIHIYTHLHFHINKLYVSSPHTSTFIHLYNLHLVIYIFITKNKQ